MLDISVMAKARSPFVSRLDFGTPEDLRQRSTFPLIILGQEPYVLINKILKSIVKQVKRSQDWSEVMSDKTSEEPSCCSQQQTH